MCLVRGCTHHHDERTPAFITRNLRRERLSNFGIDTLPAGRGRRSLSTMRIVPTHRRPVGATVDSHGLPSRLSRAGRLAPESEITSKPLLCTAAVTSVAISRFLNSLRTTSGDRPRPRSGDVQLPVAQPVVMCYRRLHMTRKGRNGDDRLWDRTGRGDRGSDGCGVAHHHRAGPDQPVVRRPRGAGTEARGHGVPGLRTEQGNGHRGSDR